MASDQYYGRLEGHFEYIFRQSEFGSVGHIAVDITDYLEAAKNGGSDTVRIDTWCGHNYKFNPIHSTLARRNKGVRNACEWCFVEYDPDDQAGRLRVAAERRAIRDDDLPF